jgi:hypothetical protein
VGVVPGVLLAMSLSFASDEILGLITHDLPRIARRQKPIPQLRNRGSSQGVALAGIPTQWTGLMGSRSFGGANAARGLGWMLRAKHDGLIREPLPEKWRELINRLDEKERGLPDCEGERPLKC